MSKAFEIRKIPIGYHVGRGHYVSTYLHFFPGWQDKELRKEVTVFCSIGIEKITILLDD